MRVDDMIRIAIAAGFPVLQIEHPSHGHPQLFRKPRLSAPLAVTSTQTMDEVAIVRMKLETRGAIN